LTPSTRSAVAAVSLALALSGCTATGEPVAGGAAETTAAAETTHEAAPRMGTASAAVQTGISTSAMTRAPQRAAPVPPPPATGPSIPAAHAPAQGAPAPIVPEAEPVAAPAVARAPAAAARPAAPAPAVQSASLSAAERTEGQRLFNAYSCGACHTLEDAGGGGQIGPALDGNAALTHAYVVDIVSNGRGAMPGFAGQMSDAEIAALAKYVVAVRK
jgi:mono/diheme cytochrome c family protein